MLVRFIRNKNGQRVGAVVAICEDGVVKTGWSKCNTKLDKFDREMALKIAVGRANNIGKKTHSAIVKPVEQMRDRALRYFKGSN
jgi:hypothetical protein